MDTLTLLKEQLANARETYEGTVNNIDPSDLQKDPGGKALPLGALLAHLVMSEDMTVQTFMQSKKPLYETLFKDKTGVSDPMPAMDENWSVNHEKWAKTLKIDLVSFKPYEKAVYEATSNYLNGLTNDDLDKEVDLGAWGKKKISYLLYGFIIGHTNSLAGEISAVKGVLGKKGYAF